tara:strand:- start:1012 stop:1353 length:342 start_codon:yes stop_codon:yes gene_type:complete
LKVNRINTGDWGKVRAFFDIETKEGFIMKGFKLVEGINGLFIGYPSQKGNDGEYRDTIWADKDLKDKLLEFVVSEYNQETGLNSKAPPRPLADIGLDDIPDNDKPVIPDRHTK